MKKLVVVSALALTLAYCHPIQFVHASGYSSGYSSGGGLVYLDIYQIPPVGALQSPVAVGASLYLYVGDKIGFDVTQDSGGSLALSYLLPWSPILEIVRN